MNKCFLYVNLCVSLGTSCIFAKEKKMIDFELKTAEDISVWDEKLEEKLLQLFPNDTLFKNLSADELERLLQDQKVQLVDVRTEDEYLEGHLPDAILLDIKQDHFIDKALGILDKGEWVAVYCKAGVRSRKAAEQLLLHQFKVYNLDQGIDEWKESEKTVERVRNAE